MTTAFDVAKYILDKTGPMSAMKLQKLLYYAQAWSLVWDDAPLFQNRIEAWTNGPVLRELYDKHRGMFKIDSKTFTDYAQEKLTDKQLETINVVLDAYSHKSSQWLSDQTHAETPWQNARKGLTDGERGAQEITHESMAEYYSSLQ